MESKVSAEVGVGTDADKPASRWMGGREGWGQGALEGTGNTRGALSVYCAPADFCTIMYPGL